MQRCSDVIELLLKLQGTIMCGTTELLHAAVASSFGYAQTRSSLPCARHRAPFSIYNSPLPALLYMLKGMRVTDLLADYEQHAFDQFIHYMVVKALQ